MMNRVVCIALLFAVFVAIHGDRGRGGSGGGGGFGGGGGGGGGGGFGGNRGPGGYRGPGGKCGRGQWAAKLCGNGTNTTLAQSFVTQVQQLITTLQNNGSFGQVLANRAQEIAYIQNSANTALLSSNCTGYFSGLKAAKSADQAALQLQQQYQRSAAKAFWNITCSLAGVSDSSEED